MTQNSGIDVNVQAIIAKLSEKLTQATMDLVIVQCGNDALVEEREHFKKVISELQAQLATYDADKQRECVAVLDSAPESQP